MADDEHLEIDASLTINTDLNSLYKEKEKLILFFTRGEEARKLLLTELIQGGYVRGYVAGMRDQAKRDAEAH